MKTWSGDWKNSQGLEKIHDEIPKHPVYPVPVVALGCARASILPPPPTIAHPIAVLPPNNRTDDPLLVASDSFWDPYAPRSQPVTVADVLAAETRLQLERRGFTVTPAETVESALGNHAPGSPQEAADLAAQGKLEGNVLYIEIIRWEPDAPIRPQLVLVALEASLIDVATGRVVWTTHRALRPTPTPGAISRWVAYMIAAREVTEELLSPGDQNSLTRKQPATIYILPDSDKEGSIEHSYGCRPFFFHHCRNVRDAVG